MSARVSCFSSHESHSNVPIAYFSIFRIAPNVTVAPVRIGAAAYADGLRPKHPVVLVPASELSFFSLQSTFVVHFST